MFNDSSGKESKTSILLDGTTKTNFTIFDFSDIGGDSDDDFVDHEDTFLADHKPISSVYGSTGTRSRSISAASLEQDTDGLDEGSGSHTYQC